MATMVSSRFKWIEPFGTVLQLSNGRAELLPDSRSLGSQKITQVQPFWRTSRGSLGLAKRAERLDFQ